MTAILAHDAGCRVPFVLKTKELAASGGWVPPFFSDSLARGFLAPLRHRHKPRMIPDSKTNTPEEPHHEDEHPRQCRHLRHSAGRGRVDGPLIAARARRRAKL